MLRSAICVVALFAFASISRASLLLYEPFDYTAASAVVGQTDTYVTPNQTWATTGTVGAGPFISTPSLTYPNYPVSIGNSATVRSAAGDVITPRISLNTTVGSDSGSVYYSMLVKANGLPGNGTAGTFIAGLNNTTGSQGTALATVGGITLVHPNGTGYSFGVENGSANANRAYNDAKIFGTSDTVLIVVSYTFGPGTADDVANIYINPDPTTGLAPGSPDATCTLDMTTPGGDNIRTFFIRDNTSQPSAGIVIDEVRVGMSWTDVVLPEPTSALILAVSSVPFLIGRRRGRASIRPPDKRQSIRQRFG